MAGSKKRGGCLKLLLVILAGIAIFLIWDLKSSWKEQPEKMQTAASSIDESDLIQKYYYEQIKEEDRFIYHALLQGVQEGKETIQVLSGDAEKINQVYEYLIFDHPEFFWCDGSAATTSYSKFQGNDSYSLVEPSYVYDAASRQMKQAEIDAAVTECLKGISPEMTQYEKIKYVFEYIIETTVYNLNSQDNQNIYSVFVNRQSVCAGYAKATQYLLENMGIFCTYVVGTVHGREAHAWNLVQCDGKYYYVDTTWGDPVFSGESSQIELQEETIDYDYLCCTEAELLKTHEISDKVPMPPCTSDDYNFYKLNGMYYESYDSETALKAMNYSIQNQEFKTVFKYENEETYQIAQADMKSQLLERAAQNLAQWYGLDVVQYYYQLEPETNKIIVYWQYY